MTSLSTSRLSQVPKAKVISYYVDADGQFGTNKIGYDVDLFEESTRSIVFGELRKKKDRVETAAKETSGKASQEEQQEVEIKKEDVEFICAQLETDTKTAEKALRTCKGSLEEALLHLIRVK